MRNESFEAFVDRMEEERDRYFALAEYLGYDYDGAEDSKPFPILPYPSEVFAHRYIYNDEDIYCIYTKSEIRKTPELLWGGQSEGYQGYFIIKCEK